MIVEKKKDSLKDLTLKHKQLMNAIDKNTSDCILTYRRAIPLIVNTSNKI